MVKLVEHKRGRGIPKDEHKIIRTAWRIKDLDDKHCYDSIPNPKSKVAKQIIKKHVYDKDKLHDVEKDTT